MSVTTVSTVMQEAVNNVPRNDIINGGLVVNQENQTAPADDAYTIGDLFLHVGEGTPVMSLETDGPQGVRPWQKMVLDANDQGGLVYFMSNADCQDYIANGKLSFGIQLKTTAATIANARIGILKWVGTADAVTSDVVGTWASDGTNPTLATSWSYENTPANIGLTTSWARHTVEDITVDSNTTNIAIFVWTDDGTITASDVIGFSEWQCNPGSTVNDFSSGSTQEEALKVDYYLQRFEREAGTDRGSLCTAGAFSSTLALGALRFRSRMRTRPTFSKLDVNAINFLNLGVDTTSSNIVVGEVNFDTAELQVTLSGLTAGSGGTFRLVGENDFVQFDSRL